MNNRATAENVNKKFVSGYRFIPGLRYLTMSENSAKDLTVIQNSYAQLSADAFGGNRYRAYSKYMYDVEAGSLSLEPVQAYSQSAKYNYDLGDIQREYQPIASSVLESDLIQKMISADLVAALASNKLSGDILSIGLHQVRYSATKNSPSISSPIWLHKDDETIVFVHLLNLDEAIIGGDNLIATDSKSIADVIRLKNPGDTLYLTRDVFHAVTPIGSESVKPSFRDIMLITFSNTSGV